MISIRIRLIIGTNKIQIGSMRMKKNYHLPLNLLTLFQFSRLMKHLIVLILISFSVSLIGQTTILSENFNDGFPAGWQLIDNDGLTPNSSAAVNFIDEAFVITEDYDTTGTGDSILVATSWFDTPGEADDWLILPSLTMGSFGNYISFDASSIDASYPDGLQIRVSTGGVAVWEFYMLDTVAYDNIAVSPNWHNYSVSLDVLGIANEDVFIAFRHVSTDDYILALDNIKVTIDAPVAVHENNNEISIYPNPSKNGFFYIEGCQHESYEVFDINGKIVANGTLNSNLTNLSYLEKGYYWIKVGELKPTPIIIE